MNLTSIVLNSLELLNTPDYCFSLTSLNSFSKNVVLNDLQSDGESFGRSKIKPKNFLLCGKVRSWSNTKLLALNQILIPSGLKTLVITDDEFGQLVGYVEVVSRANKNESAFSKSDPRLVSIQLTMPDPYFYSYTAQTLTLGSISNAGWVAPFIPPIVLGGLTGGTGTLTNNGNANAYPVITVVGTCDTISITNTTTGQTLSCAISLADTDTLVIDCTPSNRGITLNGTTNKISVKSGSWIYCAPGLNSFSFSRNSQQVKQHCSIALNSRWC